MISREILDTFYTPIYDERGKIGIENASKNVAYKKLFREENVKGAEYKIATHGTSGMWQSFTRGEEVPQSDPLQNFTVTATPKKLGMKIQVHKDDLRDVEEPAKVFLNKERLFQAMDYMEKGVYTVEKLCMDRFVNAFAAGAYALPDTKALCATDHPIVKSSATTFSNKITTAFSHDALEEMEEKIAKEARDTKNDYMVNIRPTILLHGPEIAGEVQRTLNVNAKFRPEDANNELNIYSGRYIPIETRFLQNAAAKYWFLIQPKGYLVLCWWAQPSYTSYIDEKYGYYYFQSEMDYDIVIADARQVWGSEGTT